VILLAEDDEGVSALASRGLTKEGFRVLAAADGEEAIRIFEGAGNDIAVAVLDDVMPKAGGKAVLEHIRKIQPAVPVILCTEYSWGAEESKAAPGAEILAKPYEPRDLLRCVRRAAAAKA
jgi:CheY-like chemotaxis protein